MEVVVAYFKGAKMSMTLVIQVRSNCVPIELIFEVLEIRQTVLLGFTLC